MSVFEVEFSDVWSALQERLDDASAATFEQTAWSSVKVCQATSPMCEGIWKSRVVR